VPKRTERGFRAWHRVEKPAPETTLPSTLSRVINAIVWTPRILFVWLLLCFIHDEQKAAPRPAHDYRAKRAVPLRPDLTAGEQITLQ
jgi:hypothetical protein